MTLKPRLIDDWASIWKWGSARLVLLTAVAPVVYEYLQSDPTLKDVISPRAFHVVLIVLSILTLLSKVVRFDGANQPASN